MLWSCHGQPMPIVKSCFNHSQKKSLLKSGKDISETNPKVATAAGWVFGAGLLKGKNDAVEE